MIAASAANAGKKEIKPLPTFAGDQNKLLPPFDGDEKTESVEDEED